MKSLILYDSWSGNTAEIARAIQNALGTSDTALQNVQEDQRTNLKGCDLLIFGSPTHGGVATPAMQDFIKSIPQGELNDVEVAIFDTRVKMKIIKIIGFAADKIAKQLKAKGARVIAPLEGFYVQGKEGPLLEGELARAQDWALSLKQPVATSHAD